MREVAVCQTLSTSTASALVKTEVALHRKKANREDDNRDVEHDLSLVFILLIWLSESSRISSGPHPTQRAIEIFSAFILSGRLIRVQTAVCSAFAMLCFAFLFLLVLLLLLLSAFPLPCPHSCAYIYTRGAAAEKGRAIHHILQATI